MCWSAEVSLNTFILSTTSLLILYLFNYDTFHLALILSFVFMQLLEYFIWIYINNKKILKYFGFLTYVLIFLQPIIILSFTVYSWLIPYYILLHLLWLCISLLFFNLEFNFLPKVGENKHLNWNWTDNQIYIYGFFTIYLPFLFGISYLYANPFIYIIALFTLLYSIYNYSKYNTISSMWCWSVNFLILIMFIDLFYKIIIL